MSRIVHNSLEIVTVIFANNRDLEYSKKDAVSERQPKESMLHSYVYYIIYYVMPDKARL